MSDEIADALEIAKGMLDHFAEHVAHKGDPREVATTLALVIGALRSHGIAPRQSKKPQRGVGYSKDDAIVLAHLSEYGGNLSAALRAHYPLADPDQIKVHAKRIREHTREIEAIERGDLIGG